MSQLSGQVAFITGAGGGIGREVCRRFLEEGARIVALDIHADATADIAALAPDRVLALQCDVTDSAAVRDAVAQGIARFGKLTTICTTAGGSTPNDGPITDASEDEFWRAINLDLWGTFIACKHGIPELIKAGGGSIVTLASIVATIGVKELACYSSAKGGVVTLTRSMAVDYANKGIRVNAIAPGITLTPRVQKGIDEGRVSQPLAERHLTGLVPVSDIAEMAVFLASPASRSITAQVYSVDGGAAAI